MTTWYREGLVSLTAGSDLVAGVGTEWVDNVLPGGIFFTPAGLVEVERVISDTSLKLVTPYGGATVAGAEYSIAPTQGYVVALAKQLNGVLGDFGELKDAWQDGTLVGKGVALKGVKNTVGDLPNAGNAPGDAWMVDGHLHVWTGTAWLDQGATVSTPELEALRDAAGTSAGLAIGSALAAEETRKDYEDRVYPGVYNSPPTNKPHSGAPSADGDRCVALVASVPYEHIRVGGGWLIPNVDAAQLAMADGSRRVGVVASGVGAVVRNMLDKARDAVSLFDFIPVAEHAAILAGTSTYDVAADVLRGYAAGHKTLRAGPGVHRLSTLPIPKGCSLLTTGFATEFYQLPGLAVGTRMIVPSGSDIEVGDVTVRGNIASDTDEQQHAIFIRPTAATGDIKNVKIGNVRAFDVRGDGVYAGQPDNALYKLTNVTIGDVYVDNVYRNGVSIVGGSGVRGGSVTGPRIGYCHVLIEPNATSGPAIDIYFEYVKGRMVGSVGPNAAS